MNVLKTWFEHEIYNKEIEINFRECDNDKKIKLSAVLGFASDLAGKDYTDRGISHNKMVEAKQILLLARYHFRFFRMPELDEIITFKTWEKGIRDGYILRDYEIVDSNNQVCAVASSTWFVVNPDTRKIIRPRNFTLKDIRESQKSIDCEPCERIHIDEEKATSLGIRVIYYSDLDANGHLNNANYANIAVDFLANNLREKSLGDFYINYVKEAKLGDIVDISGYKEENSYYIIGKIIKNICFVCKFTFK